MSDVNLSNRPPEAAPVLGAERAIILRGSAARAAPIDGASICMEARQDAALNLCRQGSRDFKGMAPGCHLARRHR
jgi:hypothetical protein